MQNTLQLSEHEAKQILDDLDRRTDAGIAAERRREKRHSYRRRLTLQLIDENDSGSDRLMVQSRNLSTHGLAILHCDSLSPKTSCRVYLRTLGERVNVVAVEATTVRCRVVGDDVYEIGILFSEPIDLREFLHLDE